MKNKSLFLMLLLPSWLLAVPSTIRFQGRLTDGQGRPVVGPSVNVRFSLYGVASGGATLWQGPANQTVATNEAGLFSTDMAVPMEVVGANEELYLQVHVNDGTGLKPLSPRQKLASVPYAMYSVFAASSAVATTVAQGAITSSKIQDKAILNQHLTDHSVEERNLPSGYGLMPSGGIILWAGPLCPEGYTQFTAMDGRFPLGAISSAGRVGGSSSITGLSVSTTGAHSHLVNNHRHGPGNLSPVMGIRNEGWDSNLVMKLGRAVGSYSSSTNSDWFGYGMGMVRPAPVGTNPIEIGIRGPEMIGETADATAGSEPEGEHTHEVISDGTWLPPHLTVLFCQKN